MDQIELSLWKPCKPNVVKNPSVHICFEPSAGGRPKNQGGYHYLRGMAPSTPLVPPALEPIVLLTYILSEILEMYLLQTVVQYVQDTATFFYLFYLSVDIESSRYPRLESDF